MDKQDDGLQISTRQWAWIFVALLSCSLLAGTGVFVHAWLKAQAYNRVTGSDVTVWDALLVELKVTAVPKWPEK